MCLGSDTDGREDEAATLNPACAEDCVFAHSNIVADEDEIKRCTDIRDSEVAVLPNSGSHTSHAGLEK
jgi:hypothetical protein